MTGGGGGRGGGFREINVTPLVDVMLVLLVVFMVTAPLLATGITVALPQASAPEMPLEDTRLVVSITAEERIHVDDTDVTDDIEAVLAADPRTHRADGVYIRADREARYGVVARVVAAARAAGAPALSLLVEPTGDDAVP